MNSKILLTGFKPFLNESINPSELLLNSLAASNLPLETLLLPVSYKGALATLHDHWKSQGPYKALLMLGQAGGRKSVCLERVALNWSESSYADEDGERLSPGPLHPGAPSAYISDFFPSSWKDLLNEEGPTDISFSAGTYVCNALYFEALHRLAAPGRSILFVHVPYLPEQTVLKPEQPSVSFEIQNRILSRLIRLLA